MPKVEFTGDELFNIVKSFINYHNQDSTTSRDSTFSVKNIKTIVLSPQAIIFEYHLAIGAVPCKGAVPLALGQSKIANTYMHAFTSKAQYMGYITSMKANKSCVDAIGKCTNKCQGLEEIVLVPYVDDLALSTKDGNLNSFVNGLLAGKQARAGGAMVIKELYDYYPRLRSISIASDTNTVVRAFAMRQEKEKATNDHLTLSSMGYFTNVMQINTDNWYQAVRFQAKYPYDARLEQHFQVIKNKIDKEIHEKELEKIHKERVGDSEEQYKKALDRYNKASKMFSHFRNIVKNNGVLQDEYPKQNFKFDELPDNADKKDYELLANQYNKAVGVYTNELFKLIIRSLDTLGDKSLALAIKEQPLKLPDKVDSERYNSIERVSNFSSKDIVNAIVFYCCIFTDCESKYLRRELWSTLI